jgi:hypothetical protein
VLDPRRLPALALVLLLGAPSCSKGSDVPLPDAGDATVPFDSGGSSLTVDDVVNACIRASACGIKTYPALGNCIDAYYSLYLSQGLGAIWEKVYACVNQAQGDCDAIATCFGRGAACDNTTVASCNGAVAKSCDLLDGRLYELDCSTAGLSCALASGQTITASCTPGTCTTSSFSDQCKGNLLYTCNAGIQEITDCTKSGELCGKGGGSKESIACEGESGLTCHSSGSHAFSPYCESGSALKCVNELLHYDVCSRHKLVKTACQDGICVVAGTACSTDNNRCSGTKLEACLDGSWKQYDCTSLGLGACKTASTYGANCSDPSSL